MPPCQCHGMIAPLGDARFDIPAVTIAPKRARGEPVTPMLAQDREEPPPTPPQYPRSSTRAAVSQRKSNNKMRSRQ